MTALDDLRQVFQDNATTNPDDPRHWRLHATCRGTDPNRFFTPDGSRDPERTKLIRAAQTICRTCPVRGECLTDARRNNIQHGVWGGVDMAHDNMPRLVGNSKSYIRTCAGTCGRKVATPALWQRGIHLRVADHGMCASCASQHRRRRDGVRTMSEIQAIHEDVIRQQHQRGTPVEMIAINTGYSTRNVMRILNRHREATQ